MNIFKFIYIWCVTFLADTKSMNFEKDEGQDSTDSTDIFSTPQDEQVMLSILANSFAIAKREEN